MLAAIHTVLLFLVITGSLFVFSTVAVAQERDLATLPSIEAIDATTDVTIFLRKDIPGALRTAALRRAWVTDPEIRDFKGLQENDWDFNNAASSPGFGDIGPETNVEQMVAELLSDTQPVVSLTITAGVLASAFRFLLVRPNITSPAVAAD
jgi:hypothetical protein